MSNFKFFLIICAILFSNNLFGNDTLCPIDSFLQKTEEIQYEDIDNALHQVEMIIDNFSQDSDTSCIIELYHQYALRNGTQGNYFLVFNALWKALLLADKAKLEKEQFYLNLDIGRFYSYLKRYEKADNHFKIASKLKDSLLIKNEITNINGSVKIKRQ